MELAILHSNEVDRPSPHPTVALRNETISIECKGLWIATTTLFSYVYGMGRHRTFTHYGSSTTKTACECGPDSADPHMVACSTEHSQRAASITHGNNCDGASSSYRIVSTRTQERGREGCDADFHRAITMSQLDSSVPRRDATMTTSHSSSRGLSQCHFWGPAQIFFI